MDRSEVSMPMIIAAAVVVIALLFGGYKMYEGKRQAAIRAEAEAQETQRVPIPMPAGYGGGAR